MERPSFLPPLDEEADDLQHTKARWRRCLKHALREVQLRELASWWGEIGAWLKRVKPYRPLLRT